MISFQCNDQHWIIYLEADILECDVEWALGSYEQS